MATDQDNTSKPRRRFFRYSLRTLMLVVTVFCFWLGITATRARDQRQAVEAIQEMGGTIRYEHQWTNSDPPGPEWLRRLIGDEYFFTVNTVYLAPGVNDKRVAAIKRLTHLKGLSLSSIKVTNAGLVHLRGLTNLRRLDLTNTKITDAGLVHLKGLTSLRSLTLWGTKIGDVGMEHLKGLTNLQTLNLAYTQVTDAGLDHMKGLTMLNELVLANTKVTDEGVKKLRQTLPDCQIHD